MKKLLPSFLLLLTFSFSGYGQYCTSSLYNFDCSSGDDLDYIILNNYSQTPTGCTTGNFGDYTSDTIDMQQAVSYILTVATNYPNSEQMGAWIDFNNDQDFDDAGEFVATSGSNTFGAGNPYTTTLNVGNAPLGTYRFRVRVVWNETVSANMSCTVEDYGEIHDYIVRVLPAPPCPPPFALTASNLSDTSATLGWASTGASSWTLIYGSSGFNPATGGTVVTNATNPQIITGLTAITAYDFYVISDCGTNGVSDTSFVSNFTTLCAPYTATYLNDFENDSLFQLPFCWGQFNTSTSASIEVQSFRASVSGSRHLELYNSFSGPNDTIMAISPDLSDMPVGDKQIGFWANTSNTANVLYVGTASDQVNGQYSILDTIVFTKTDTYEEFIIPLTTANGYNGTDHFIFLMHGNGSTFSYVDIDDFEFQVIPPCPKITGIGLVNATSTSATISFSSSGTTFDYEWGPAGFIQGTGTAATVSTNPFTITGLSPQTAYDIYIRNNCTGSGNGISVYSGPYTFMTPCAPTLAPLFEGFDFWRAGNGNTFLLNDDSISPCYTRTPGSGSGSYMWMVEDNGTGSFGTGPNGDNSGSGNFIYTEASSGLSGDVATILTPQVDVTALNFPFFSFFYHASGTQFDKLEVEYWTGTSWDSLITFTGAQQSSQSAPYIEFGDTLSNLTTDTTQIRFVATRGIGLEGDWAIDDIKLYEAPACNAPSLLSTSIVTSSSALISWTTGGGVGAIVEYGLAGFIQNSGTKQYTTQTSLALTGLTPNTSYDVYVQDTCSGVGTSIWVGPITFRTSCLPFTMPYTETFDLWPLSCWDSIGGSEFWSEYDPGNPDHYAVANYWNWNGDSAVLTSPPVSITQNAQVRFDWSHLYDSFYDDKLVVRVQAFGSPVWDTLLYLQGSAFNDPTAGNTTPGSFIREELLLDPNKYTGDTVIVQLFGTSGFGPDLYINDFNIENAPLCPKVINAKVQNVIDTAALLNWTGYPNAGSYEVWFGPQGFYQGTSTINVGTILNTTGDSLQLDTLRSNTCYEYLVRALCSGGDTSVWVGPISFCTPCQPFNSPYLESYNVWPLSCWSVDLGTDAWKIATGSAGDNYAMADFWNVPSGGFFIMRSPLVFLQGNSQLSFDWSHLYDSFSNDELIVRIRDVAIGTWDTLYYLNNASNFDDPTATNTTPGNFLSLDTLLDPATYTGKMVQVEFYANSGFGPNLYINDFYLGPVPTCFEPTNLTVTNVTSSSASVSWVTGGATNWEVLYGTQGFVPGSGAGTLISPATNPQVLTGLSPSTTYDVYVRDSCGPGDVSFWNGPVGFTTACVAVMAPYMEQFAGTGLPNCYDTYGATGTIGNSIWRNTSQSWPAYGAQGVSNFPGSSGFAMGVDGSAPTNDTAVVMETGEIDITNLSTPTLTFQKFQNNIDDPLNMTLYVDIFDGSNWNMGVFSDNTNDSTWVEHQVSLSQFTITGPIRIAFRVDKTTGGINSFYGDIIVDDIVVDDGTGCSAPDSLNATNLTCTTADLIWITYNSGSSIIEYGPAGFMPGTGAGTLALAQSPLAVTGLSMGTSYEFYVADTCASDTSSVMGPFAFTTPTGPLAAAYTSTINPATLNDQTVDFDASSSAGATSYDWDFGDGTANGNGMMVSHAYTANGTFNVTLTITGPCGIDSITQQVIIQGVSLIENELGQSLELYPNPATDEISVAFNSVEATEAEISITDLSGKVILSVKATHIGHRYQDKIDISKLAKGTYILKIENGDLSAVRRVVKH